MAMSGEVLRKQGEEMRRHSFASQASGMATMGGFEATAMISRGMAV